MALNTVTLLERTKKQLRSVLISEKNGVAADRLEGEYYDLVSGQSLQQHMMSTGGGLHPLPPAGLPAPGGLPQEPARRLLPGVEGWPAHCDRGGQSGHGARSGLSWPLA